MMKLFTDEIMRRLREVLDPVPAEIEDLLQIPTDSSMGDYALPCFQLAKKLRKAPAVIAKELSEKIRHGPPFEKIEAVNGYLNFFVGRGAFAEAVLERIEALPGIVGVAGFPPVAVLRIRDNHLIIHVFGQSL